MWVQTDDGWIIDAFTAAPDEGKAFVGKLDNASSDYFGDDVKCLEEENRMRMQEDREDWNAFVNRMQTSSRTIDWSRVHQFNPINLSINQEEEPAEYRAQVTINMTSLLDQLGMETRNPDDYYLNLGSGSFPVNIDAYRIVNVDRLELEPENVYTDARELPKILFFNGDFFDDAFLEKMHDELDFISRKKGKAKGVIMYNMWPFIELFALRRGFHPSDADAIMPYTYFLRHILENLVAEDGVLVFFYDGQLNINTFEASPIGKAREIFESEPFSGLVEDIHEFETSAGQPCALAIKKKRRITAETPGATLTETYGAEREAATETETGYQRILHVDDKLKILLHLNSVLRERFPGQQLLQARDHAEAMKILQDNADRGTPIDLVVTDLKMGNDTQGMAAVEKQGGRLIAEIRNSAIPQPDIVVLAAGAASDEGKLRKIGANAVIDKLQPGGMDELLLQEIQKLSLNEQRRGMVDVANALYTSVLQRLILDEGRFQALRYENGEYVPTELLDDDGSVIESSLPALTQVQIDAINEVELFQKPSDGSVLLLVQNLDKNFKDFYRKKTGRSPPHYFPGAHYGVSRSQIYLDFSAITRPAKAASEMNHEIQEQSAVVEAIEKVVKVQDGLEDWRTEYKDTESRFYHQLLWLAGHIALQRHRELMKSDAGVRANAVRDLMLFDNDVSREDRSRFYADATAVQEILKNKDIDIDDIESVSIARETVQGAQKRVFSVRVNMIAGKEPLQGELKIAAKTGKTDMDYVGGYSDHQERINSRDPDIYPEFYARGRNFMFDEFIEGPTYEDIFRDKIEPELIKEFVKSWIHLWATGDGRIALDAKWRNAKRTTRGPRILDVDDRIELKTPGNMIFHLWGHMPRSWDVDWDMEAAQSKLLDREFKRAFYESFIEYLGEEKGRDFLEQALFELLDTEELTEPLNIKDLTPELVGRLIPKGGSPNVTAIDPKDIFVFLKELEDQVQKKTNNGTVKPVNWISIGGNSLLSGEDIGEADPKNPEDFDRIRGEQKRKIKVTLRKVLPAIRDGGVITHGNGPEVGVLLERRKRPGQTPDEILAQLADVVSDTQDWIAEDIIEALVELGVDREQIVFVPTHVAVDGDDSGFQNPTKPIGIEPAEGPDTRPRVASPIPLEIVEMERIKQHVEDGKIVICVGGGGIPVDYETYKQFGRLEPLPAVIDKDLATVQLAKEFTERGPPGKVKTRRLIISTAVPCVYLNFGDSVKEQKVLVATPEKMKGYIEAGHFAAGSMLPKVQAAVEAVQSGAADEVIITNPENISRIDSGGVCTRIVRNIESVYSPVIASKVLLKLKDRVSKEVSTALSNKAASIQVDRNTGEIEYLQQGTAFVPVNAHVYVKANASWNMPAGVELPDEYKELIDGEDGSLVFTAGPFYVKKEDALTTRDVRPLTDLEVYERYGLRRVVDEDGESPFEMPLLGISGRSMLLPIPYSIATIKNGNGIRIVGSSDDLQSETLQRHHVYGIEFKNLGTPAYKEHNINNMFPSTVFDGFVGKPGLFLDWEHQFGRGTPVGMSTGESLSLQREESLLTIGGDLSRWSLSVLYLDDSYYASLRVPVSDYRRLASFFHVNGKPNIELFNSVIAEMGMTPEEYIIMLSANYGKTFLSAVQTGILQAAHGSIINVDILGRGTDFGDFYVINKLIDEHEEFFEKSVQAWVDNLIKVLRISGIEDDELLNNALRMFVVNIIGTEPQFDVNINDTDNLKALIYEHVNRVRPKKDQPVTEIESAGRGLFTPEEHSALLDAVADLGDTEFDAEEGVGSEVKMEPVPIQDLLDDMKRFLAQIEDLTINPVPEGPEISPGVDMPSEEMTALHQATIKMSISGIIDELESRLDEVGVDNKMVLDAIDEAKSIFSQTKPSGNFALTADGQVSGPSDREKLTNTDIGDIIRPVMESDLPRTRTSLDGDIIVETLGEMINSEDLADRFNSFLMKDESIRKMFAETRLAVLANCVAVADDSVKGSSYAHYGESFGSTVFIGEELLEELLDSEGKNLDCLKTLLKIEMERKRYRMEKGLKDFRSSAVVVKEAGISAEEISRLKKVIAKAEARKILKQFGHAEVAEAVERASAVLDSRGIWYVQIGGVEIGKLKGAVLDAVAEELAEWMKTEAQLSGKRLIGVAGAVIKKQEEQRLKEAADLLTKELMELFALKPETEVIVINLLSGDVSMYSENAEPDSAILEDAMSVISMMVGKRAGDAEWVLIDNIRNSSFEELTVIVRNCVEALLNTGEIPDGYSAEHMEGPTGTYCHLSHGKTTVSSSKEAASRVLEGIDYFRDSTDKEMPVVVDGRLLEWMDEMKRTQFIMKNISRLAILDGKKIHGLSSTAQEQLNNNWKRFKMLPENNQIAIVLSEEGKSPSSVQKASILPLSASQVGYIDISMDLAGYIASVGKDDAVLDDRASKLLRQILREFYETDQISEEALAGLSIEEILNDPEKFLLPPVYNKKVEDIDSYIRAQKAIDAMA
ncbi:MAG: hypothetical protein P9M03_03505 [Candidatus Theseobacter exili]|nr:hypothetical protein [Candidatus Theseobacter exili]